MGDVLYFHGYNIPHTEAEILAAGGDESKLPAKSIWWQGTEYKAWPCELEDRILDFRKRRAADTEGG